MSILARFAAKVGFHGPIIAAEKPLWSATRSLQDVADLTARWLAGEIQSQPGYYGPVDVDEDLAPGLTAALVAANHAGFLTMNSQAGATHYGQNAWVVGYALPEIAASLAETLGAEDGYTVTTQPVANRDPWKAAWMYGDCGREAHAEICRSVQVDITDPDVGPNTLWADLYRWAER